MRKSIKLQSKEILKAKAFMSAEEFCSGKSRPFAPILRYIREVSFSEEPNYELIISLFKQIIINNG
jgi:hypothetical protein